ncbi:hypothetical protein M758_UG051900 [Ceratodon purpureus]|nr:hypothetical protein M758_UG051900 [Ceratodon purpureus]
MTPQVCTLQIWMNSSWLLRSSVRYGQWKNLLNLGIRKQCSTSLTYTSAQMRSPVVDSCSIFGKQKNYLNHLVQLERLLGKWSYKWLVCAAI